MTILSVQHLSYNFGAYWALKNVSFALEPADFLFITGPSGAGKTTMLRLLYADLPMVRGTARIASFDLNRLPARNRPLLRREVSVVFQDFKILLHRSVFYNVAISLVVRGMPKPQIERRVRAVLRSLELDTKQDALCGELSGGEQQRVAIARSIVVNPQVLLADEPTGNLDPDLSLRIMQIFQHFNAHGTTIILATHSPELLHALPRAKILHLSHGDMVPAPDSDPHCDAAFFS